MCLFIIIIICSILLLFLIGNEILTLFDLRADLLH